MIRLDYSLSQRPTFYSCSRLIHSHGTCWPASSWHRPCSPDHHRKDRASLYQEPRPELESRPGATVQQVQKFPSLSAGLNTPFRHLIVGWSRFHPFCLHTLDCCRGFCIQCPRSSKRSSRGHSLLGCNASTLYNSLIRASAQQTQTTRPPHHKHSSYSSFPF